MTDRHPEPPPGKSAVRVAEPPEPCFNCEATVQEQLDMVGDALYTLCRGCMAKALRVQRGIARRGGDPPMRQHAARVRDIDVTSAGVTQGRRVYLDEDGYLTLAEGDYGQEANGTWSLRPPGHPVGGLVEHRVEEHEDGTITVSPSIILRHGRGRWHGYLERGVWREA